MKNNLFKGIKPLIAVSIAVLFLIPSSCVVKAQDSDETRQPAEMPADTAEGDNGKSETPGTIPGTFMVDLVGQASYSMAVQVPPGTAGMEPKISITYNSALGNGFLGEGFYLEGLSSINRDAADVAHDGYIATCFSNDGKLSLDSQRLIEINGWDYKFQNLMQHFESGYVPPVEFRKQIDDNTRIKAWYSPDTNSLAYFTVEQPNGIVITYGRYSAENDQRIYPSSPNDGNPYAWALCRVQDQYGNYMIYDYEKDQENSVYRIYKIKYTGHDSDPVQTPNNELLFWYQDRNDKVPGYVDGSKFLVTTRLFGITTKVDDQPVLNYKFSYEYGSTSGKSRIQNVKLYDAFYSNAFRKTQFQWYDNTTSYSLTRNNGIDSGGWADSHIPMDVNGDGRSDIVQIWMEGSETRAEVNLAKVDYTGIYFEMTSNNNIGPWGHETVYNSGEEIHSSVPSRQKKSGGSLVAWTGMALYTLFSCKSIHHSSSFEVDTDQFVPADFDGDGKDDLFKIYKAGNVAHVQFWKSNGGSFDLMGDGALGPWTSDYANGNIDRYISMDANGDHRDDLVRVFEGSPNTNTVEIWRSTGDPILVNSGSLGLGARSTYDRFDEYLAMDITGDGRDDLVRVHISSIDYPNKWVFAILDIFKSDGCNFIPDGTLNDLGYWGDTTSSDPNQPLQVVKYNQFLPTDINGDGLGDLVKIGRHYDRYAWHWTWYLCMTTYISNGITLQYLNYDNENLHFDVDETFSFFTTEINGDGKTDISFAIVNQLYTWYYWIRSDGLGTYALGGNPARLLYHANTMYWNSPLQFIPMDVDGNGLTDIVHCYKQSPDQHEEIKVLDSGNQFVDYLRNYVDGNGFATSISYAPITSPGVYLGPSGSLPPNALHLQDSRKVVYHLRQSSGHYDWGGNEDLRDFYYLYKGAKMDRLGYGFLGFETITAKEKYNEYNYNEYRVTNTSYYQQFPYIGLQKSVDTLTYWYGTWALISSTSHWYTNDVIGSTTPRYRVKWGSDNTLQYNYDSSSHELLSQTYKVAWTYDEYGNPLHVSEDVRLPPAGSTNWIHVTYYTTTYENRVGTTQWIIGLPSTVKVDQRYDWSNVGLRTTQTNYVYNDKGLLWTKEQEPSGSESLRLLTWYEYDTYGNIITLTYVYQQNGQTIFTQYDTQYDARGQFKVSETNPLSQTTSYPGWNSDFGLPTTVIDQNGLTTITTYDNFGRPSTIDHPDDRFTTYSYGFADVGQVNPGGYYIQVSTSGSPTIKTVFNKCGKVVSTEKSGFQDNVVYTTNTYDLFGRLTETSQPDYSSTPEFSTTYTYDMLDRILTMTKPIKEDGTDATTTYTYNGFETITTDPLGHLTKIIQNALGQVVESIYIIDGTEKITSYQYDTSGNLITQTDPAGIVTQWEYDILNRLMTLTDPNKGCETYTYNALNELIIKVNPKNQMFTMEYDLLGRMTRLDKPEGFSIWVYDNPEKGIGKIWQTFEYKKTDLIQLLTSTEQIYDPTLGLLMTRIITIGDLSYMFSFTYDLYSRLQRITYPTCFSVECLYDVNGYTTTITNPETSTDLWECQEMNAFEQITKEKYGNRLVTTTTIDRASGRIYNISCGTPELIFQKDLYIYDAVGNVQRQYVLYDPQKQSYLTETFEYDELNRLKTIDKAGSEPVTIAYDPDSGNIIQKSDVASITPPPPPPGPQTPVPNYIYPKPTEAHPNAVQIINENYVGGGVVHSFKYDDSGNMVSHNDYKTNTEQVFYYNSLNLITGMESYAGSHETSVTYTYNEDGQKVKQVEELNDNGIQSLLTEIRYVDNLYEEYDETCNGQPQQTENRHYIYAAGRPIGLLTTGGKAKETLVYLHSDRLGSLEMITDGMTGEVVERFGYNAFGKRRSPDGSPYVSVISSFTNRGFTGQRHVDYLDLIDMKARMYDPHIGMFQSVDPLGGAYTYCRNNPLRYTDPTGLTCVGGSGSIPDGWIEQKDWAGEVYSDPNNRIQMSWSWTSGGGYTPTPEVNGDVYTSTQSGSIGQTTYSYSYTSYYAIGAYGAIHHYEIISWTIDYGPVYEPICPMASLPAQPIPIGETGTISIEPVAQGPFPSEIHPSSGTATPSKATDVIDMSNAPQNKNNNPALTYNEMIAQQAGKNFQEWVKNPAICHDFGKIGCFPLSDGFDPLEGIPMGDKPGPGWSDWLPIILDALCDSPRTIAGNNIRGIINPNHVNLRFFGEYGPSLDDLMYPKTGPYYK